MNYLTINKGDCKIKNKLAWLIIRYTNPCALGVILLTSIVLLKSDSFLLYGFILGVFFVIFPLFYVHFRTGRKLLSDPTLFLREHPLDILILDVFCALSCLTVLVYLNAPIELIKSLTILSVVSTIVATLNIFYRVSYHLSALVTIIGITSLVWGNVFLVALAVVPLAGWAKYHAKQHSILQMVMGIAIAVFVCGGY